MQFIGALLVCKVPAASESVQKCLAQLHARPTAGESPDNYRPMASRGLLERMVCSQARRKPI